MTDTSAGPSPAVANQRRDPRALIVAELHMHSRSNFYTGFTRDISEGGVFLVSYLTEPVGTAVSMKLGLPGGFEIEATGVVRWVREPRDQQEDHEPPGMGIQFLDLDAESQALIREFVENRAPLFYPD